MLHLPQEVQTETQHDSALQETARKKLPTEFDHLANVTIQTIVFFSLTYILISFRFVAVIFNMYS